MMRKKTFYQLFGKRILDILLSGIALIVLSPIILIVGILVRIKLGSPIIFKQLPELINIFKGDMSIVGPRPLLVEYLELYNAEQKRRHLVRPGLTGLAQINGRNAISWTEKFQLDCEYVDSVSFKQDIIIFFFFIKKVLVKEGISSSTSVTNEKFKGS